MKTDLDSSPSRESHLNNYYCILDQAIHIKGPGKTPG